MGGELTNLLVGVLLFGMFISGVTIFYGDMADVYGVGNATDVSEISQSDDFTTKAMQIKDSVQDNAEEDESNLFGVSGFLLPLQLILSSFDALGALVTGGITALNENGIPIPDYVAAGLLAIIAVVISLAVVGAILKRDV